MENATGYKDWNCDIVVLSKAADCIVWHEMLHSASVSYYDENTYLAHKKIEEYSVELLTREICKEKGIEATDFNDDRMKCFLIIGEYLGYKSNLQFARDLFNLFNQPLIDRYDWLEEQYCDKMLSDGLDTDEMNSGIDYIRMLQGGFEDGGKSDQIV